MRRAALFITAVLIVWFAGGVTQALDSLARPVPGVALVRFSERYGSEHPRTHCGIDLSGEPGEPVRAPCGGTVVFAGLIPADGGGRTGAVTIEPEGGVAVTVSPLAEVAVTRGDAVDRGATVGVLAAAGDASSNEPHLHLSVRRDGRYVDPEPLLEPHGAVHGSEPGQTGAQADSGPSAPAGRYPETVRSASVHAATAGSCAQAAGGVAPRQAAPSTHGAAEPRTGSYSSAIGADAYGVRAAYWRATTSRRSIRSALGSSPAVDREAPRDALVALRPRSLSASGAAVTAGAAGACAAVFARRRAAQARA